MLSLLCRVAPVYVFMVALISRLMTRAYLSLLCRVAPVHVFMVAPISRAMTRACYLYCVGWRLIMYLWWRL